MTARGNKAAVALRAWRKKLGFSQTEAGIKLGTDPFIISRWERGRRRPDLKSALLIERVAAIPPSWWMEPETVADAP